MTTTVSRTSAIAPSEGSLSAATVATASSLLRPGSTAHTIVREAW